MSFGLARMCGIRKAPAAGGGGPSGVAGPHTLNGTSFTDNQGTVWVYDEGSGGDYGPYGDSGYWTVNNAGGQTGNCFNINLANWGDDEFEGAYVASLTATGLYVAAGTLSLYAKRNSGYTADGISVYVNATQIINVPYNSISSTAWTLLSGSVSATNDATVSINVGGGPYENALIYIDEIYIP